MAVVHFLKPMAMVHFLCNFLFSLLKLQVAVDEGGLLLLFNVETFYYYIVK